MIRSMSASVSSPRAITWTVYSGMMLLLSDRRRPRPYETFASKVGDQVPDGPPVGGCPGESGRRNPSVRRPELPVPFGRSSHAPTLLPRHLLQVLDCLHYGSL